MKINKKGFFLSETMVVISVVAVILLGVFKLFSSVYYRFIETENYNTANAINALSNVQKYFESLGDIDTNVITEDIVYVDLTNDEKYQSDYYTRLKSEFNIDLVYLIDLNKARNSNKLHQLLKRYLDTLKNQEGIILLVTVNGNEFAYTKLVDYSSVTLIGDEEDEFGIYLNVGDEFVDPGYTNWEGDEPVITWENGKEIDVNKEGTYYLHYDFNDKIFRRKVVVGGHAVGYISTLSLREEELNNGLKQTYATYTNDVGEEITEDAGIRYVGADPNNYVYFNCKDIDSNSVAYGETNYNYATSCEKWRIIGVFNTKTSASDTVGAKRVKIVRDALSVNMSWDSSSNNGGTDNNSGYGINQWGPSTYADGSEYEGADLMRMLNGYYIGKEGATCTYCNAENQGTCENNCSSTVTPLSTTSLNMIEEALWYTGAQYWIDPMTVSTMYAGERGTRNGKICVGTTYEDGKYCTDTVNRTTEWEGLVGLIYPSDYGYASTDASCSSDIIYDNSTCENNNWLYPTSWYWTISPSAAPGYSYGAWRVFSSFSVNYDYARTAGGVRPSLYLSSNVQITGGDGTNTTPYILR